MFHPDRDGVSSHGPPCQSAVVLTRSRSGLERLGILLLVGGVLLPSSMAYGHDPTCPHHVGSATRPSDEFDSPDGERFAHGADLDAEHASHRQGPDEPATEDCRCAGGLCALVFSPERALPASGHFTPATATESATREAVPAADIGPGPDRLQPPATGPPPAI